MDALQKNIEFGCLLSIYGSLLTSRQATILDLYYNDDLSLAEISQLENISRQGVHDSLKRGETLLLEFEEKLRFYKNLGMQREILTALKCDLKNDCDTNGAIESAFRAIAAIEAIWED